MKAKFLMYALVLLFVVGASYYSWQIGRRINYAWSYESMVRGTICETVKKEALLPGACP